MVNRRYKAREIPDHSSAERDDKRRAIESCFDHPIANCFGALHRFRFFPRRDCDQRRPAAGRGQTFDHGVGKVPGDIVIRDHRANTALQLRADQRPGLIEKLGTDEDFVGLVAGADADWLHHDSIVPTLRCARKRKGARLALTKYAHVPLNETCQIQSTRHRPPPPRRGCLRTSQPRSPASRSSAGWSFTFSKSTTNSSASTPCSRSSLAASGFSLTWRRGSST